MIGILSEGGNVFKDADKQPLTQRINQTDISSTVAWLEDLTGLDLRGEDNPETRYPTRWLGSTGKKIDSGDLDLSVDANEVSKEALEAHLKKWAASHGFKPEEWVKKSGNIVHFKTPINGRPDHGFVQTDFTFLTKPSWSQFVLTSDPNSQYKGALRNIMMNSIAKSMGYKLNQNDGIADRATNKIITDDPDAVAKLLLNKSATRADLYSVESILKAIEKDPAREQKIADFKAHMERAGTPFEQPVSENTELYTEVNFLARLRDRIVNQGMTPIMEAEIQGGRAKGIEHIEDLVFRKGSKGIAEALDIIEHVAQDTKKHTTIKWDGKPAIIFGRKPDGTFVLTDVSGFNAKSYDGLATSPEQLAHIQGNRPGDRTILINLYAYLWPRLKDATPKNFRGYVQGDLLYLDNQPPVIAGAYTFKPNTIEYRIPVNSQIGQMIENSDTAIAMHTKYSEPGAPKEPIGNLKFNPVPGLLLMEPVSPSENIKRDNKLITHLKQLVRSKGASIDQLFDPADLRSRGITDLPRLCIDYINSVVKDPSASGFTNMLHGFGEYLKTHVTPRKFANIIEYLQSPRSNMDGIVAAFSAFIALHDLKMHVLQQLDQQHPGNEGWVMATPAGMAKAVNRFEFTRQNAAQNNPKQS